MNEQRIDSSSVTSFEYEQAMGALAGLVSTPEDMDISPEVLELKAKKLGSGRAIDFVAHASDKEKQAFRDAVASFDLRSI